jgi:cytochrome oxidase assembly protein ShyY1
VVAAVRTQRILADVSMLEAPPRLTPRDLRRPGWLAAHAGIVMLALAFALLGRWQWDVGHKVAPLTAAELTVWRTPQPVAAVITADGLDGTQVGQAVSLSGAYDSARQLLVPGRTFDGRAGYYVLAPFVTGSGDAIVVNRGFLAAAGGAEPAIPAAPAGRITVTGWAAEPESTTGEVNANGITEQQQSAAATAPNEIQFISPAALVNQWPYHLPDAYVTATDAASPAGGLTLIPAPLPLHGTTWDLLNVCYAFQWWLFIGILGSWYVIYLRRELRPRPLGADGQDGDEDLDDEDEDLAEDEDGTDAAPVLGAAAPAETEAPTGAAVGAGSGE